ncbi:TAXI family TRAP transporter solute-binding subunit [Enterovirga rhinocerotis]|uniref:TRAP transporter TAXI family solute receptor n=1 Tax=Enterovirga rhinocerotis TaxID=1339210 RepID=A0A4R7C1R5_9HYPH|nr:TAXI family TRAP transporter solute-binding subunit [Enterovirga rhinocerotis]TDR90467.1 TRAP transporter TAXI family solute receptor [Enterovirga rhinocerotis]
MREAGFRSDGLLLVAALVLGAMGLGYVYFTSPTELTVAVGPAGSAEERLILAFGQQLKAQKIPIRLRLEPVAGVKEAAERLDAGKADLAVVRPDVRVPENGLTLAILRDAATILIAPKEAKIEDVTGLVGKRLGIVTGHEADPALVATLLRHFDLEPPAVSFVELPRQDAAQALKEHRVDAIALIAAPTGAAASGLVREVAHAFGGEIAILPVENPDGITQRSPFLSATTIPEGIWGGRPKQPADEIKTIGVAYRLMAHSDTDRSLVSTLVEALFQMRSRLAVKTRLANFMRPPEMDTASSATSAMLPNHPGAVDYFQRETQSVMDRYGDWIYLGAFFGSGAISALAWSVQRFRRRRREVIDDVLDRLLDILADARKAETTETLDLLTNEVDDLFRTAVEHARDGQADNRTTSAIVLALDGARSAIDERRRKIMALGAEPPRSDGSPLATVC